MKTYTDHNTQASHPGNVAMSKKKFGYIRDNVFHVSFTKKFMFNRQFDKLNEFLLMGDIQPAIVFYMDDKKMLISAYSEDLDAVMFLDFPIEFAKMYNLKKYACLVTTNTYYYDGEVPDDLVLGENYLGDWIDFNPLVQLFLTDNESQAKRYVNLFDDAKWDYVAKLTAQKIETNFKCRHGFFYFDSCNGNEEHKNIYTYG